MSKYLNDELQYGDRVPYGMIRGEINGRLVDRAVGSEALACIISLGLWEMIAGISD